MKILMIAPQPFFAARGTPFSVYYRLLTLSELGHEIDVVTYHVGEDVAIERVRKCRSLYIPFITKVKIGPSFTKILLDIFVFIKALHLLLSPRTKYDLLYVHEEALFFGIMFKKIFNVPLLYDMHSSLPQQFANFNCCNYAVVKGVFRFIEKNGIKHSDHVLTICEALDAQVRDEKCDRTTLVENTRFDAINFVNEKQQSELQKTVEHMLSHKGDYKVLFYSGTFEKYQGIPLLLESLAVVLEHTQMVKMVLIGGTSKQIQEMDQFAKRLGVADFVIFGGMMDPNAVKRLLPNADVLLSFRVRGTNTPLKLYEYMASGKPIVATRIYSHTQLLDDTVAFLAEPNVRDYGKALIECLSNGDDARNRAEGARVRFNTNYSLEKYRSKLKAVLDSIVTQTT